MASPHMVLGVAQDASKDDIKKAYRTLAKQFHPDINKDEGASERFQEIQTAYDTLTDEGKQSTRSTAHAWGGADFGNAFNFSAGFQFRQMLNIQCNIEIRDAYRGCEVALDMQMADGATKVLINLPAGVTTGSRLKVNTPDPAFANIDLFVVVNVVDTNEFQSVGANVIGHIHVGLWDAILGTEIDVAMVEGSTRLVIPAGTKEGDQIRIAGQGMPRIEHPGLSGDFIATVHITMPELSEAQKKIVAQLRDGALQ